MYRGCVFIPSQRKERDVLCFHFICTAAFTDVKFYFYYNVYGNFMFGSVLLGAAGSSYGFGVLGVPLPVDVFYHCIIIILSLLCAVLLEGVA